MQMVENDKLLPEYDLDFSTSKPNHFAEEYNRKHKTVVLDADIAEKFPSLDSVNKDLRFLVRITEQPKGELRQK